MNNVGNTGNLRHRRTNAPEVLRLSSRSLHARWRKWAASEESPLETIDTRAPDPPSPGSIVTTAAPLPGSVLGAATIVVAQGTLAAIGTGVALFAGHATRIHYLGRGIGAWRFVAAAMLAGL